MALRGKRRYLTQSYDKSPYIQRQIPKSNVTTQKRHHKPQLHNDCGPTKNKMPYRVRNLEKNVIFINSNDICIIGEL